MQRQACHGLFVGRPSRLVCINASFLRVGWCPSSWYNKQTLPFAQRINTIYTWFTHLQICMYVQYICMYIVFFRILMYPTNISRLRAEVFPKFFRGLPFPGCKKYSSLKRYPQSWIHDSTSLDPFDPIRLDVTRLNSDPTVEMDLKLRWKNAGFFRENAG